ncbi:histidine kinase [Streptomonospora wellingtoniae]|uniref:histidine kinase n=1 Tax=Streptomonospora wellingtoniae TaxID=3075544 RepID=A0ABU2KQG2_9ACTN|nr:histidine kinase [Streptomonospora sp. DSM 45055]MDT0301504.1 histidine kinase [Streptomonospora sp. DSM 45055]
MSDEERSADAGAHPRQRGSGAAGGGPSLLAGILDALWQRPSNVARQLPDDGSLAAAPPLLGGVCAGIAARRGRPAAEVRRRFARPVAPLLAYPLLWLVRIAERPDAEGRERFDGILFAAAAALAVSVASAAELSAAAPGFVAAALGVALGAPLLALRTSVLLAWRWMTAALLVASPAYTADFVPFPSAAVPAYLAVLFLVGTQYARPVVVAAGMCTAAMAVVAALAVPAAAPWSAVVAAAALLLGDNVRMRREYAGRLRHAPGAVRSVGAGSAGAVPQGAARGALPADPASPAREGGEGGAAARARRSGGVPGPASVARAVADALWRTPAERPHGPLRLLHGAVRPSDGRIVGGVCAAFAHGSQPMAVTLRVLFAAVAFPLGVPVYLLLWILLPREGEVPDEDGEGPLPPVLPREATAWFLLLGVGVGISALAAVQLVQFHGIDPMAAVPLGLALGLPFALLPVAPLLAWRITAAGMFASLVAVALFSPPVVGGSFVSESFWPWPIAALVSLPVVLYAVAVTYPGRTAAGVGVVTAADIAAASLLVGTPAGQALWIAAIVPVVLLFGYNVRSRRAAQRQLAQESALRRRDRARQAVLEERSRIARELHDVVSHHMSMIAIQADAAPYKFTDLHQGPAATFTTIRDAAREALAEMRRVVGLLREEDEVPEGAPQPGLALLPELVANARRAAMDVTLEGGPEAAGGAARGLPDAVDLSAYRIVQESVSNAGRHAPGAPVSVALSRTAEALTVRVANGPPGLGGAEAADGARPESVPATVFDSGGHGLIGMRERVAMLGGQLRAAPTEGGGFDVVAELPLDAAADPAPADPD